MRFEWHMSPHTNTQTSNWFLSWNQIRCIRKSNQSTILMNSNSAQPLSFRSPKSSIGFILIALNPIGIGEQSERKYKWNNIKIDKTCRRSPKLSRKETISMWVTYFATVNSCAVNKNLGTKCDHFGGMIISMSRNNFFKAFYSHKLNHYHNWFTWSFTSKSASLHWTWKRWRSLHCASLERETTFRNPNADNITFFVSFCQMHFWKWSE